MGGRSGLLLILLVLVSLLASCSSAPVPEPTATPDLAPTSGPIASLATATTSVASGPLVQVGMAPSAPTVPSTPTASPVPTSAPTNTATAVPTKPPAPTATSTPAWKPPATKAARVFLGYYVPYDPSSWQSLEANAAHLDYVATQSISLDACGNIGTSDDLDLNRFARAHGIGVLPSVFTTSGAVNHSVLTNTGIRDKVIRQLVDYVVAEDYAGLDVDLEGVAGADRPSLTDFIRRISAELHSRNKLLTMAIPAKTSDVTTGWAGAFDYDALAPHVDYFTIMTYAYTTASSDPGSTAPATWVDKVAAYAASEIPPSKVLLGLAFYGYDWNVTTGARARALRYPEAEAVFRAYGTTPHIDSASKSATFTYSAKADDPAIAYPKVSPINHDIRTKPLPACGAPPTPTPGTKPTPKPTVTPTWPQQHVVWLEDAASVAVRIDLARKYGLRGVFAWRLGQEDPAVWPLISAFRQGS